MRKKEKERYRKGETQTMEQETDGNEKGSGIRGKRERKKGRKKERQKDKQREITKEFVKGKKKMQKKTERE